MKTRARELVLSELLEAIKEKERKITSLLRIRRRAEIDQECIDVTDEVKTELANEHEVFEALHELDIEALEIKISCLKAMILADSVDI